MLPFWSTEQISLFDDDHTIFLLVAVEVSTDAVSVPLAPTLRNLLCSLNVVTSITHVPPFKAVTTPCSSTVATVESLEKYVTFLFSASAGSIVGIIAYFDPTHISW